MQLLPEMLALRSPPVRFNVVIMYEVYACLANLARQHRLDFFEQALSDSGDREESLLNGEPSLKLVWVF